MTIVEEVQRRVRVVVANLRSELKDAGHHPLDVDGISVEETRDGLIIKVTAPTAKQRKAYDDEQAALAEAEAAQAEEATLGQAILDEMRLDQAVLGGEEETSPPGPLSIDGEGDEADLPDEEDPEAE